MYVKHKLMVSHPRTKVQAIRWLKSCKGPKKWANKPKKVRWITNRHKNYSVDTYKTGIYTPKYNHENNLINAHNNLTVACESYFNFESGNSYGVCDNVQNFLEVFDEELKSIKEEVFVILTPIFRKCQPEYGGWRWHKWGPYIGNHDQQHEYLYHESIDVIWIYQIFVVSN